METQGVVMCRLCLKICSNFNDIKGNIKHALDLILPKIDLAAIKKPVICRNCTEVLIKCSEFKTICFHTRDYIIPFINDETTVKVDLRDVYLSVNETGVPDDQDICTFCLSPVTNCSAIFLEVEGRDLTLKNMIEQCVPELDLNIIKKPVICTSCHSSLENCFHFVMDCLIVEEKIKKYCEIPDMDSKDKVELGSILEFKIRDVTTCEENKLAIKEEIKELDVIKTDGTFWSENKPKEEYLINEEIEIKTEDHNFSRFEDGVDPIQPCSLQTKHEEPHINHDNLKKHLQNYKDPLEVTMYKCDYCSFETKYRNGVRRHLLVHKNPSEITMYKCDSCLFQTKYKKDLKTHSLNHKDLSEVTMYKCDSCSFETRHKQSLKDHFFTHKDVSELTMYKCNYCPFKAKRKRYINRHLLTHKDPSEVTMFKCEYCPYQTKVKGNLKLHLRKHKDASEVKMHECDYCPFQTKHKNWLKCHMLKHKDPSEVTMYKCASCSYQTKLKNCLRIHLLRHKDPQK